MFNLILFIINLLSFSNHSIAEVGIQKKVFNVDLCICKSNSKDGFTGLENIRLGSNVTSIDCSIKSLTVDDQENLLRISFDKSVKRTDGKTETSIEISSTVELEKSNEEYTPFEDSVFSVNDQRFIERKDGYFFQYSSIHPNSMGNDYYYSVLWVDRSGGKELYAVSTVLGGHGYCTLQTTEVVN